MEYEPVPTDQTDNTVLELLDRVLNTGVVLVGDVAITVADIELVYLRLQLMLSSAETARQAGWLAAESGFDGRRSVPYYACSDEAKEAR